MANLHEDSEHQDERHVSDIDIHAQALWTQPSYAAHWLFGHLNGIQGVPIPDTALFDDEGVLEAWLYTRPANSSQPSVIVKKEYVELNLLRLEAHLQDLARETTKLKLRPTKEEMEKVVAIQWGDEVCHLTEQGLDTLIRQLCARERDMTAFAPQLDVSRLYPGRRFVLQAHEPFCNDRAVVRFQVLPSRWREKEINIMSGYLRHGLITHYQNSNIVSLSRDALYHIENQLYTVLQHLESEHIYVNQLTLEFAVQDTRVVLVTGHSIQLFSEEMVVGRSSQVRSKPARRRKSIAKTKDSVNSSGPLPHRHDQYRVCRHCRAPVEVELSRALMQNQTTLRAVVAKYQNLTEQKQQTEQLHAVQSINLEMERSKGADLEHRVEELEYLKRERERELKVLREKCSELETELANEKAKHLALIREAQVREKSAIVREKRAIARERALIQETQDVAQQESQALATRMTIAETEREQLTTQLQTLETTHHKLERTTEEMRVEWEEMRFLWHYVRRKLTDTSLPGVFPPKRVAGGFSCYPIPSPENVEQVVKWIVDYEAKRMLAEAQLDTVRPRLKLKIDMIRVLGVGKGKTKRISK